MNHKVKLSSEVWHDLQSRGLIDAIREYYPEAYIHYVVDTGSKSRVQTVELNDVAVRAVLVECRVTISNIEGEIQYGSDCSEERSELIKWRRMQTKLNSLEAAQ